LLRWKLARFKLEVQHEARCAPERTIELPPNKPLQLTPSSAALFCSVASGIVFTRLRRASQRLADAAERRFRETA